MTRSSVEAKFRSMALGICELLWLEIILEDWKITWETPMRLYYHNKSVINIAHNRIQHDHTKHIKVDRHFTKEKLDNGLICTLLVFIEAIASVLTKGLSTTTF